MAFGGERDRIIRGLGIAGRQAELEQIFDALESAEAGTSVVQVLEGVTGAGKTELLGVATTFARQRGFAVGEVATSVVDQHVPFSVAVQLCENARAQRSENGVGNLARILSELGFDPRTGAFADVPEVSRESSSLPMIQALAQVVDDLVRRGPLVLAVDDLQWCDVPTLRWLAHITRRMRHAPLALLVSRTTGARTHDGLLIADLMVSARRVKVGGLGEDGVADLIVQLLGVRPTPEFVAACLRATSGNPLVLRHLLQTMRDDGVTPDAEAAAGISETRPEELGLALLARINRQDGRLVRLARAVAVVEPSTLEFAAAVTGAEVAETADLAHQLMMMGLFSNDEVPVFSHHIVGTAVANSLSHAQRDELHALAAKYLHEIGASQARVAFHLQRTKTRLGLWAARTLFGTAQISIADGDPRSGEAFLRRALLEDLPVALRAEMLMCLGFVEMSFDPSLAAGYLWEALEHLENPADLVEVASRLAQLLFMEGRYEVAVSALRQTIGRIGPHRAKAATRLRLALQAAGPAAQTMAERIDPCDVDPAWRRGGTHGRMVAVLVAEEAHKSGTPLDLCRDAARVALSRGATTLMRDPQRLIAIVAALVGIDEIDLAMRSANELVAEGRRQGLALMCGLGHALRSTLHFHRGALAEALADAQLAFAPVQSRMSIHHFAHTYCVDALVRPLLHLGEIERARELIDRYGLYGSLPRTWHHTLLLNARGRVRIAIGDAEGALADQLDCGENLSAWGAVSPAVRPWRSLAAHAHLALGQRTEALAMAMEELRLAREMGAVTIIGQALLTMGSVVEGPGAIAWLAEAASVLEDSPARLLRAHVLHRLGAAQWQADRQEAAATNLAAARLLAERCGAKPVLEALDRLPVAQDGCDASPTLAGHDVSGLTPHEYRVAALVVAGNSNDEVADKLSVSRRAIEYHLTNIYRKLGVRRRTQLTTVLVGTDQM